MCFFPFLPQALVLVCSMRKWTVCWMFVTAGLTTNAQEANSVIITEIMSDPSPVVGLPNTEWIELTNTSNMPVDLKNWRVGDAGSQSGLFPSYLLQPDSMVIICSTGNMAVMQAFGSALGVSSFPSLDNDGDAIWIRAANGKTIHFVQYAANWHTNALKKDGGWSLEMIDIQFPCIGNGNWSSSTNGLGGTPGHINSIAGRIPFLASPQIQSAYVTDPFSIVLEFSQPLDSTAAAAVSNYTVSGGMHILKASPAPPSFTTITLQTDVPLEPGLQYTLQTNLINACGGLQTLRDTIKVGLFSTAVPGNVVINEILFNPPTGGADYVELYNNSAKVIDAGNLFLAGVSSSGSSSQPVAIVHQPYILLPGEYMAVTTDTAWVSRQYPFAGKRKLMPVSALPSMPDDKGQLRLLGSQGELLDELAYQHSWHFPLLADEEGVSLERLDPSGISQYSGNWHSAASTTGFGTPGYKNSQGWINSSATPGIMITPTVFSPDNDGVDDVLVIRYSMNEPGYVGSVIIFNRAGKPVRKLVAKALMGNSGAWTWDGLDAESHALLPGIYIIFIETLNLRGKRQAIKKAVVLTRKP